MFVTFIFNSFVAFSYLPQPEKLIREGQGFLVKKILKHGTWKEFGEFMWADLHIGPHYPDQLPGNFHVCQIIISNFLF